MFRKARTNTSKAGPTGTREKTYMRNVTPTTTQLWAQRKRKEQTQERWAKVGIAALIIGLYLLVLHGKGYLHVLAINGGDRCVFVSR